MGQQGMPLLWPGKLDGEFRENKASNSLRKIHLLYFVHRTEEMLVLLSSSVTKLRGKQGLKIKVTTGGR